MKTRFSTIRNLLSTVTIAFTVLLTSCSSTDVIMNGEPEESNTISIAVSAPEALQGTRADAHNGLKLRFTAKLFKGDKPQGAPAQDPENDKFIARQEIIPAESGNYTFTFKADKGEYCVALFADYIDADAQPDNTGHYPDKYYDTTSTTDYTEMLALHSKDNHTKYTTEFINNDDFDCFYALHSLTKDANAYEKDVTLTRAVCKIRICEKEGSINGIKSIKLSKLSYLSEFSHINKGSGVQNNVYDTCLPDAFVPNLGSNNELFWFFSFGSHGNSIGEIAFSIEGNEGWEFKNVSIPSGAIKNLEPNKVYKVSGNFITPTNSPSNEIRITVDHSENWDSAEDKSITVKQP